MGVVCIVIPRSKMLGLRNINQNHRVGTEPVLTVIVSDDSDKSNCDKVVILIYHE